MQETLSRLPPEAEHITATEKLHSIIKRDFEPMPFGLKVGILECAGQLERMGYGHRLWGNESDMTNLIEDLGIVITHRTVRIGLYRVVNQPMVMSIIGRFVAKRDIAPAMDSLSPEMVNAEREKAVPKPMSHFIQLNWRTALSPLDVI